MTAFQSGAFQSGAFQIPASSVGAAFQPGAFQFGAFQTTGSTPRVIIRGDDAPRRSWKQDFYDRQIAEVDRLIRRMESRKKKKATPAVVTEALDLIDDLPPIIVEDASLRLRQAITEHKQRGSVVSVLRAVAERARQEQRRMKRRRDEEIVLMYVL